MGAHGGWIASPVDLVRFVTALDGPNNLQILGVESVNLMVSPPDPRLELDPQAHYGIGWSVRPVGNDANWWHGSSLDGTHALLVRTHHRMVWAALFNSRPKESRQFGREIDGVIWQGIREVTDWPSHDLFPHFGYK